MEEKAKLSPFEKRIHEIDFLRGLLMCLVILDHFFNLMMAFNKNWMGETNAQPFYTFYNIAHFYWTFPEAFAIRKVVRWLCLGAFCFVSGISCAFSRDNWKRAGQMIVMWLVILIGSNILEGLRSYYNWQMGIKSFRIDFNIIGVLAFSTLAYCFVQNKSWKWLLAIGIIGLLLHPLCVVLSGTEWGKSVYAPMLWRPDNTLNYQADHMALFPYLSFFFGGALLSKFTYSVERKSYFKRYEFERPICLVGRHSLLIYISHFFILMGFFGLVGLFVK